MTVSTCNDGNPNTGSADCDTKISIFCSCDDPNDAPDSCVAGQDDLFGVCDSLSTKLSWPTDAGHEYFIMVHGYGPGVGDFELALLDDGFPTTTTTCLNYVDSDGDGVPNVDDYCSGTILPEDNVPEEELKPNHFTLADNDSLVFEKGATKGNDEGNRLFYNTEDTFGCSCEQIIDQLELGKGHRKFGCSPGVMECWTKRLCNEECSACPFCGDNLCQSDYDEDSCSCPKDCFALSANPCLTPHPGTGCDNEDCTAIVCGADSFCCNTSWDGLCADRAQNTCNCGLP